MASSIGPSHDAARERPESDARPALLAVEPEALLRWSLTTYFQRWFSVHTATTVADARQLLDRGGWAVVIVSDNLADGTPESVEQYAHTKNASTLVVRIVTHRAAGTALPEGTKWLEKPFELSQLAAMVGVQPATVTDDEA